ncbi:MAG: hypothetical protein IKT32_02530, partial [Clostridia bacterium]|nr:hypothetical protein [Clostridia bacterium]
GAEYAVKVMRIAVNQKGGSINRANGSITRVYMGKVDPSTGMPSANWDKVPVYEYYFAYDRQVSWNSLNKISIRPGDNTVNHSMTISSNKYCAVKTDIKGEQKLHKVARGSNVDLANFINFEESEILIGWSKGASTYSADDFVASKVYENIQTSDPTVYKALTMKLAADKKASLKFRQRKVDGQYLPMEASLKWNVTAEDNNNLATYFGGIKFGYKLSANGKSMEAEVSNLTNGYTAPYSYSVIQSNIDEASWGVNFTCQAYVEFAGVKYYSEAPASEDGRSVSYVANAAANDLKVAPEGKYLNEIVDEDGNVLGYSYLTQKQYDLVARIAAAQ